MKFNFPVVIHEDFTVDHVIIKEHLEVIAENTLLEKDDSLKNNS